MSPAWPACWSRWHCWSMGHDFGRHCDRGGDWPGRAVGFWALYILVIPAALAFPLVWFGFEAAAGGWPV